MVFYLKINRNEKYTFRNLQHWIDIMEAMGDAVYYILCDHEELKEEVLKQVIFRKQRPEWIESCRSVSELSEIVSSVTDDRWSYAGYAHLTTFWHAKERRYMRFWNIDADDTCICLSADRVCEMLRRAERYAEENHIDLLSLDIWYSRTRGYHWSFGITYTDNTPDWFSLMRRNCENSIVPSGQIKNMDGFFSDLRKDTDRRIETFYAENMKFIHYADDFIKRPDTSGFFHWKDGRLILPILQYCFGLESSGAVPIAQDAVRFDMGITDKESTDFLMDYALPSERERLKTR